MGERVSQNDGYTFLNTKSQLTDNIFLVEMKNEHLA